MDARCKCGSTWIIVCPQCHEYTQTWKWISVKDKLPCDPNEEVLAIDKYGCIRISEYGQGSDGSINWWYDQNFDWDEVTHWMPLPSCPEVSNELD